MLITQIGIRENRKDEKPILTHPQILSSLVIILLSQVYYGLTKRIARQFFLFPGTNYVKRYLNNCEYHGNIYGPKDGQFARVKSDEDRWLAMMRMPFIIRGKRDIGSPSGKKTSLQWWLYENRTLVVTATYINFKSVTRKVHHALIGLVRFKN